MELGSSILVHHPTFSFVSTSAIEQLSIRKYRGQTNLEGLVYYVWRIWGFYIMGATDFIQDARLPLPQLFLQSSFLAPWRHWEMMLLIRTFI